MISIIVPVYNVDKYLDRCIESICQQSYNQIEIILVNDGSGDHSEEICRKWQQLDSRIIYIYQDNQGVSAARNTGLRNATGEYIGFVDGDDWIDKEMYEILLRSIQNGSADVAMCGFDMGKDSTNLVVCTADRSGEFTPEEAVMACLRSKRKQGGYFTSVWNKLYRRKAIEHDSGLILFNEDLIIGEDEVWLLNVLFNSEKITAVSEPLYHYFVRSNSAIGVKRQTQRFEQHTRDSIRSKQMSKATAVKYQASREIITAIEAKSFFHASRLNRRKMHFENEEDKNGLRDSLKESRKSFYLSDFYPVKTKIRTLVGNLFKL